MISFNLEDFPEVIVSKSYGFFNIIEDDMTMIAEKDVNTLPPYCERIAPLDQFIENGRGLQIGEIPEETNIYTKPIHLDKISSQEEKGLYNPPGKTSSGSYYEELSSYPNICDFVFTSQPDQLTEINQILRTGGYCIIVTKGTDFIALKHLLVAAHFTPIYIQSTSYRIIVGRKSHVTVKKEKALIIYTLHNMSENVEFFLRYGIFESPTYDFLVVINNPQLKIRVPKYVRVINRENKGFDFGAWSVGIFSVDRTQYSHFILINNSVIGPFVNSREPWPERFLEKLNDKVKLVGTTINSTGYGWGYMPRITPHVQSMVLAMPLDTLENLIEKGIISNTVFEDNFMNLINKCETGTSRTVIENEGNIAALVPLFNDVDFRVPKDTDSCCHSIFSPFHLSKICINSDIVFVKTKGVKMPEIYRWTSIFNNCKLADKVIYNDQDITKSIFQRTQLGPWSILTNVNLYTKVPFLAKWVIDEQNIPDGTHTLLFTRIEGKLAYALLN